MDGFIMAAQGVLRRHLILKKLMNVHVGKKSNNLYQGTYNLDELQINLVMDLLLIILFSSFKIL